MYNSRISTTNWCTCGSMPSYKIRLAIHTKFRRLERAKFLAVQQNDDYGTKIKLP